MPDDNSKPEDLTSKRLRAAVEWICNDRRGLHWEELDREILADLRAHVERVFKAILTASQASLKPSDQLAAEAFDKWEHYR